MGRDSSRRRSQSQGQQDSADDGAGQTADAGSKVAGHGNPPKEPGYALAKAGQWWMRKGAAKPANGGLGPAESSGQEEEQKKQQEIGRNCACQQGPRPNPEEQQAERPGKVGDAEGQERDPCGTQRR